MHLWFFVLKAKYYSNKRVTSTLITQKEIKLKTWGKKRKEKATQEKTKKKIKASFENVDCATKARCGLRPLLCVQSQTLSFDLVHRITAFYDYNDYNFVDI